MGKQEKLKCLILGDIFKNSLLRSFETKFKYKTDVGIEYNISFDLEEEVEIKGEKRVVKYGTTPVKVPLWRLTMKKNSFAVTNRIGNDHYYMMWQVVAFYWIHLKDFNRVGFSIEQRTDAMKLFVDALIKSNDQVGIDLQFMTKPEEDKYELLLEDVWVRIKDRDMDKSVCRLSDTFPLDDLSAKYIKDATVRRLTFELLDYVREDMNPIDRWETLAIIQSWAESLVGQGIGRDKLSGYIVRQYYSIGLGMSAAQRKAAQIIDTIQTYNITDIEKLSELMGYSQGTIRSRLYGDTWAVEDKKSRKIALLLGIVLDSDSKGDAIQRAIEQGISRPTVYRLLGKDLTLKTRWAEL